MIPLAAAEDVIDASGVAPQIEHMLASGARRRPLGVLARRGGREKDAPGSLQSTASDALAFLNSAGTEASSRSSQTPAAHGSPSGSSLPSALAIRPKVYSACR